MNFVNAWCNVHERLANDERLWYIGWPSTDPQWLTSARVFQNGQDSLGHLEWESCTHHSKNAYYWQHEGPGACIYPSCADCWRNKSPTIASKRPCTTCQFQTSVGLHCMDFIGPWQWTKVSMPSIDTDCNGSDVVSFQQEANKLLMNAVVCFDNWCMKMDCQRLLSVMG